MVIECGVNNLQNKQLLATSSKAQSGPETSNKKTQNVLINTCSQRKITIYDKTRDSSNGTFSIQQEVSRASIDPNVTQFDITYQDISTINESSSKPKRSRTPESCFKEVAIDFDLSEVSNKSFES